MNKKILTTAIALSAALTLIACGQKTDNKPAEATTTNTTQNAAAETTNNAANKSTEVVVDDTSKDAGQEATNQATAGSIKEAKITREEAFDKFLELHPGAKVDSFKLEHDDGVLVYSVDGYDDKNEYEVDINAIDGTVKQDEVDKNDGNNAGDIQKDALAKIDQFIEESHKDAGDDKYYASSYGLDYEDGKLVAEVELSNGSQDIDYDYDYETGKLLQKDM